MVVNSRVRRVNAEARTALRVIGAVLLVAGIVLVVVGFSRFSDNFGSSAPSDSGVGPILMIAGGGFLTIFGLAALRMGFLRAELNYLAGEGSDAIRSVAGDVAAGMRSAQPQAEHSGSFCPNCGARHAPTARFCDACGHALAAH